MLWSLRKATAEDIRYLGPRLRSEDVAECRAGSGLPVEAALFEGLANAQVVLGLDNLPIAIFGVEPLSEITGAIWMTATPALTQAPYVGEFMRQSRAMCDTLNEQYPLLCNVVDARNTVHIRWLEWCGFIFINRHEAWGHEKRPFLEFIRIKQYV